MHISESENGEEEEEEEERGRWLESDIGHSGALISFQAVTCEKSWELR